jgi:hypothetical protein
VVTPDRFGESADGSSLYPTEGYYLRVYSSSTLSMPKIVIFFILLIFFYRVVFTTLVPLWCVDALKQTSFFWIFAPGEILKGLNKATRGGQIWLKAPRGGQIWLVPPRSKLESIIILKFHSEVVSLVVWLVLLVSILSQSSTLGVRVHLGAWMVGFLLRPWSSYIVTFTVLYCFPFGIIFA